MNFKIFKNNYISKSKEKASFAIPVTEFERSRVFERSEFDPTKFDCIYCVFKHEYEQIIQHIFF